MWSGAYYLGTASTHRLITIAISKVCDARVFGERSRRETSLPLSALADHAPPAYPPPIAINYRLSPEVRFPCALHDVIRGYMRLTESLKISPENIIVMGDSAGGSLAIALAMYLRDEGYQLPRALVVMSPWVDMTMSCGSWDENSKFDVIPMPDGNGE
jgi:acetyl esterase/lipase